MKKVTQIFFLTVMCVFSSTLIAQNFSEPINQQLSRFVEQNELLPQDVQWQITSETVSKASGIQHVYFRQLLNEIEIYGTESSIHIMANGNVIANDSKFIKSTAEKLSGSTNPGLTAAQAVQAAALQLGYTINGSLSILKGAKGVAKETLLSDGGISLSPIPARLMYALTETNQLVLCWDLSIEGRTDWWSVRVNATTGEIVNRANWMVSCATNHDHSNDVKEMNFNTNLYDIPNYKEIVANTPVACTECYEVFALPLESPYYGARTIEVNPASATASPYGWHDTNGVAGAEYTTTRGNNVNAYEDGNNSGYQPNAGSNLEFTGYPFSQVYSNSNQYEDSAITNLFYMNNVFHDILYQYGFDEINGNFQQNNYGNGGSGNDYVNAEAQDGSGTCNANFGTPPDGGNPRMQMYICNDKDGDFDNLVILHEYGHGVSNRLTGGPSASSCLQNSEQMGEGWSDFFGVILSIEPGDVGTDSRAVGTYLFGQGQGGGGIRDYPYSTDISVNPQTYDFIKTAAVPHGVGSVWAEMLWEVTWALIDEHGFDTNPYNFTGDVNQDAGNIMAMALVIEGLKLQPCSPGFVDGRDAIMAADQAIYGGANECILWDAFAKRGLGFSANQGSSGSRSDGIQAFDTPSQLASLSILEEVCASSDVLTDLGGGSPSGGVYSGPGVTDNGNGSTFTFDPAAAGVGVHTVTYNIQAGACSIASSDTDTIEVLAVPVGPTTTGASDFCVGDSVTVTATLNDPTNVIRWFDAQTGGNFLFEGETYTFIPTGSTNVYAQENAPGPLSQLVISEINLQTPDRFEIQNVGVAKDYTGYKVAVSDTPYTNINSVNTIVKTLGNIGANSVVDWNDDGGAGYWGNNIFWNNGDAGWILIIDPTGDVVDSVFWNYSASQISAFNVTIGGFNVTAADLDWTGVGASLLSDCGSNSYRRNDDTNSAADWSGTCLTSDFGTPNSDINLGASGCPGERTIAVVTAETVNPDITCPANVVVQVPSGTQYTLPDYTGAATATDNCSPAPVITQNPVAGTMVGAGVTTMTMTAKDAAGNEDSCTFTVTVDEVIGVGENEFYNNILLYPNPTSGQITLMNKTTVQLENIIITDVKGRTIKTIDLTGAGEETNISLDNLATGMYFVKINAENASVVKRIVKQ
ncbi:Zinc metalloprotease (elastase) [Aequorivita sublithincola DSM 14238]|uniref:Zinc metalloprotease (Elastase) n=1 Tax=Aequorivita sublithincola (strain DSM 14238 / LMG 21431 / ACAM 643 / 9-3) TaxID=746697 RepID=I3YYC2_AEQSU|nr:M36 family metallopeptidase [Aequorivita sublithincola]AFL81990.1 Zinc metalloprotease (elastase) [Aequorivita sublithincola DSM 14238]